MGNKQRIADEIIPIMLDNSLSNTFVDLFCGSCSIIQRIPDSFHRIANDKNRYLIKMWKALINGVDKTKINITSLSVNIQCLMILNVFGQKKLQTQ